MNRLPLNLNGIVFPVSKPVFLSAVKILISNIKSTGKGKLAIYNQYFSVIAVIKMCGKNRNNGNKNPGFKAICF